MVIKLETLQIRLPKNLLEGVDKLIKSGFYRSRSEIIRQSLQDYLNRCSFFGMAPYITGPYTKEQIDRLKGITIEDLIVPVTTRNKIDQFIKSIELE